MLDLRHKIRDIPNFPKPGIIFRDITPLLLDSLYFQHCLDLLEKEIQQLEKPDVIAGIESRGFIFGPVLAHRLSIGFIPIRKQGKLPYHTVNQSYNLEYGSATIEIHQDAIEPGQKVLIVDDLIATGGTARAACDLVKKLGGRVAGLSFVVELGDLQGRKMLNGEKIISLIRY